MADPSDEDLHRDGSDLFFAMHCLCVGHHSASVLYAMALMLANQAAGEGPEFLSNHCSILEKAALALHSDATRRERLHG